MLYASSALEPCHSISDLVALRFMCRAQSLLQVAHALRRRLSNVLREQEFDCKDLDKAFACVRPFLPLVASPRDLFLAHPESDPSF